MCKGVAMNVPQTTIMSKKHVTFPYDFGRGLT